MPTPGTVGGDPIRAALVLNAMNVLDLSRRMLDHFAERMGHCSSMWAGDHPDWEAARVACRPTPIAAQVAAYERAFLAVSAGRARYERDSLLKDDLNHDWPLLTALAETRAGGARRLVVLDVGGALASVFWQHLPWLEAFEEVHWNVVERPEIVAAGRRLVDDPRVRFFDSIPAALTEGPPDLALGAALLPMVPDPFGMTNQIAATGARRVFLDRISVIDGAGRDLCTRQVVPRWIYESESPFWFFDAALLRKRLGADFRILGESTSVCDAPVWVEGRKCRWVGFLLEPHPR